MTICFARSVVSHPMSDVSVRIATGNDLEALARLFDGYRQFYGQPSDLAGGREFLSERLANLDTMVLIALAGDVPVGFAHLFPSWTSVGMRRIWILNDVFVAPEARERGVGRTLMVAAAEFGRQTGAARMILQTASDNMIAQSLYEDCGWEQDNAMIEYRLELD